MRKLNAALAVSLLLISALPLCDAQVGYCIDVTVNNSTMSSSWSRCQSTVPLFFNAETRVTGNGNFSRHVSVDGFAKIGLNEASHGGQGRLVMSDLLSLSSQVDWIEINEAVINESLYIPIKGQDRYTVKINESLPTNVYSKQSILYRGKGMYAKNVYMNDDKKISTSYHATDLLKSVASVGILAPQAYVFADVTPARALQAVFEKRGMAFALTSTSDLYSGFSFVSDDAFIDEAYVGKFKMKKVITTQLNYTYPDIPDRMEDYLPCCTSANFYQIESKHTGLDVDEIFSCDVF
ncbi:MAG: hypothetical protein ACPLLR_03335 [Methanothrix sp.]|uniref:hypothetical protein n=2 Tax=Methanothrix sp. TaxID=90426 RepID=UPI003C76C7D7